MIFCNSGPIAAACYLANDVVTKAIDAFICAIVDLVALSSCIFIDKDLQIDFGFCKISIVHKSIKYRYQDNFVKTLNKKDFEQKMRRSDYKTKDLWETNYESKWDKSA